MINHYVVLADDNTDDDQLFANRTQTLQDETKNLCSYIEGISLITTKNFIRLMQDAHINCPDMKGMEVALTNIANQADEYHSHVTKHSNDCKDLLFILTKSLDNGDMVDFYLKEGNYSIVTNTLDKWHAKFLTFKSKFYVMNTPLDIMHNNKKIFYYDNWIAEIIESAKTLIILVISSVALMKVFKWIGFIFWIVKTFSPSSTNSHQQISSVDNKPLGVAFIADSYSDRVYRRKQNPRKDPLEKIDRNCLTSDIPQIDRRDTIISSKSPSSDKLHQVVTIIVWLIVLCGLIVIIVTWYPSKISILSSSRLNWYPDATATLDKMRIDNDQVQSDVLHQIGRIEKLQSEANIYHDKTIQANADELVRSLGKASHQASKEVSDLYIVSKTLSSEFRQAYKNIETKAKKAGKLSEAKNLLVNLEKVAETHDRYHRSFHTLMIHHQKLLPTLKEQTIAMQQLVQEGHVMKIRHVVNEHIDILMNIDNYTYNVSIVVKELLNIVGNEGSDGIKKMIEELKSQTTNDQFMTKIYGAAGSIGGALGGTVSGLIALKSGYALVSITAATVAGPIGAAAGTVGLLGLAAYSITTNFKNYDHASRYSTELDILENLRGNFQTKMENLKKAVTDQQAASKTAQEALNRIATHAASFSNKMSFILPTQKRIALSNELLHIIQQYNNMIPIFNAYEIDTTDDHSEHLLE